jgi:DNA-binding beta-propeller fold protein YncE
MKRTLCVWATFVAVCAAVAAAAVVCEQRVIAQAAAAPRYQNVPLWPQPLPNHWVFGAVSGVAVDAQDHVWVVHRGPDSLEANEKGMMNTPPTSSVCCVAAPAVLEFNQAGVVLSSWGGTELGFTWPSSTGGMAIDGKGDIWIAAYGPDPAPPGGRGRGAAANPDETGGAPAAPARGRGAPAAPGGGAGAAAAGGAPPAARGAAPPAPGGRGAAAPPPVLTDVVTKYSRSGQMILQIGRPGDVGAPDSHTSLNRPAAMTVDDAANEVYVADSGNHRVVVFDATTGAYKRHWGAYGDPPTAGPAAAYDPAAAASRQFRDVTCVKIAKDGMVYVCDRSSDRIQVFQKDGKFVKEMAVSKDAKGATTTVGSIPLNASGSVWDLAFSSDPQQRYVFVADGVDDKILVLQRDSLAQVGTIGDGGRQMGRFVTVGSIAVDSRGNLYTGEQHHAKRVQKFVPATAAPPAGQ